MTEITISEFKKFNKKPKGLIFIENILVAMEVPFDREFKFCDTRKFRADIYFTFYGNKYLVEYEGLPLRGAKSGHVTITGYTNNCQKYTLAALMGYRVLRYTALNYNEFEKDLEKIMQ